MSGAEAKKEAYLRRKTWNANHKLPRSRPSLAWVVKTQRALVPACTTLLQSAYEEALAPLSIGFGDLLEPPHRRAFALNLRLGFRTRPWA